MPFIFLSTAPQLTVPFVKLLICFLTSSRLDPVMVTNPVCSSIFELLIKPFWASVARAANPASFLYSFEVADIAFCNFENRAIRGPIVIAKAVVVVIAPCIGSGRAL